MIDRKRAPVRTHTAPIIGHVSPRLNETLLSDLSEAINLDLFVLNTVKDAERGNSSEQRMLALGRRIYALEYLKSQLFSKYVILSKDGASLRRDKAIEKWLVMESRNNKTNKRLLAVPAEVCGMSTDKILSVASEFIRRVIGEQPPKDVLFGTFSGGASTSQRRGPGAVAAKFGDKADVTPPAWEIFKQTLEESETWLETGWKGDASPRQVPGNILFTVPKNSKIDRVAAKEPDLNMFAQKGIGNYFRAQLRHNGVDLNDQTINQRLAEEGSRERIYATVDLSSASDSVSTSIVRRLLAPEWFDILDRVRSRTTLVNGVEHELDMFSSMGNGFTFELESLIFWGLMKAVAYLKGIRGRINVYGDDIVVPVKMFPMLDRLFNFFGFILNRDKSFGKGDFRESCGKHFYKGCDVTPFFIRQPILHQSQLILALNNLTSWLQRNSIDADRDVGFGADGCLGDGYIPDFPFLNKWWEQGRESVDRRFRGGSADWISTNQVLVSSDKPKSVLRNATREVALPDDGAYLHWLRIRHESLFWPDDGKFIGPFIRVCERPSIWDAKGAMIKHLTLREPLITSQEVFTLESEWVVRPYRDVMYGLDLRK